MSTRRSCGLEAGFSVLQETPLCTRMEYRRTPQRTALRKVKKTQTSTTGRRIPVKSYSSATSKQFDKQFDNDRDQEGIPGGRNPRVCLLWCR